MPEGLESSRLIDAFELDGFVSLLVRAIGLLFILAGLGVWVFTQARVIPVTAALILVGMVVLVATELLAVIAR